LAVQLLRCCYSVNTYQIHYILYHEEANYICRPVFRDVTNVCTNIQAQTTKKKGISDQGKGAIIGGAGGAVAGGLIGHNVGGALIGGAIGAGGGYIIGNETVAHVKKKERARRIAWRKAHPRHHARPYSKTTTVTTVKYQ
jgi:uncharacterized protein YcfJ